MLSPIHDSVIAMIYVFHPKTPTDCNDNWDSKIKMTKNLFHVMRKLFAKTIDAITHIRKKIHTCQCKTKHKKNIFVCAKSQHFETNKTIPSKFFFCDQNPFFLNDTISFFHSKICQLFHKISLEFLANRALVVIE